MFLGALSYCSDFDGPYYLKRTVWCSRYRFMFVRQYVQYVCAAVRNRNNENEVVCFGSSVVYRIA